ncbi:MAG: tetratricopeptide repeat protein [Cyanobacteria bacterium J06621_11]
MFRRLRQYLLKCLGYGWPFGRRRSKKPSRSKPSRSKAAKSTAVSSTSTGSTATDEMQSLAAVSDRSRHEMVSHLNQALVHSAAQRLVSSEAEQATVDQKKKKNAKTELVPRSLDQPDLINSLADSAYVCECQGRFGEAERLYRQALGLSMRRFGEAHLEIAPYLSDLAMLYCLQKRYTEAIPLLSDALNIRKQVQVAYHPDIGETYVQLANAHQALQQYRTAETLLQSALDVFRQSYGPQHSRTKTAYCDLMQLIAIAIGSGQFGELSDEAPPLDLNTLGETHSWAKPTWLKNAVLDEDYGWIRLFGEGLRR